jgi:hypothetical protein
LNVDLFAPGLLALGGVLLGLGGLLFRPGTGGSRVQCAGFGVVLALSLAAAFDQRRWFWQPLLLLAGVWTTLQLLRTPAVLGVVRLLAVVGKPRVQSGCILLAGVVGLAFWMRALDQAGAAGFGNNELRHIGPTGPPPLEECSLSVYTDAGQRVPVFHLAGNADTGNEDHTERKYLQNNNFAYRLIRTGDAEADCNCHGWVFAQGQGWIRGAMVEAILHDNDYTPTDAPRPGDIVVYRNETGEVLHSAVVRMVLETGVLLESKWGRLGRYLHRPEDQGYGINFTFYHTTRGSNVLRGLTPDSGGRPATLQGG